jgi:hypothetical protein
MPCHRFPFNEDNPWWRKIADFFLVVICIITIPLWLTPLFIWYVLVRYFIAGRR